MQYVTIITKLGLSTKSTRNSLGSYKINITDIAYFFNLYHFGILQCYSLRTSEL